MFTGIVQHIGTVTDTRPMSGGRRVRIDAGPLAGECGNGASVCVSGVCLTVADVSGALLSFDVVTETLEKSTIGAMRVGRSVNLELSLRASDRLDGHFLQGHVDGRAVVQRVESSPREHVLWLRPDAALLPYIIPKGSVSVDGVSLTIATVTGDTFSVALIPTTLERTTLSDLSTGEPVNIESDIITRTVVHRMSELVASGGLTAESLKQAGFA